MLKDALGEEQAELRQREKASREQDLVERPARARWSFLAWSFFLAQVASSEAAQSGFGARIADEEPSSSETPEAARRSEIAAQQPLGSRASRSDDEAEPDSQPSAQDSPEAGKLAKPAEIGSSECSAGGFDSDASATPTVGAGVGSGTRTAGSGSGGEPATRAPTPAEPGVVPDLTIDTPLIDLVNADVRVGLENGVDVAVDLTEGAVLDAGLDFSAWPGAVEATIEVGPPLLDGAGEFVRGLSDQLMTDMLAAAQGGGTSGMMEVLAATGLTDIGLLLSDPADGLEPLLEPVVGAEVVASDLLGIGGSTPLELLSDSGTEGGSPDPAAISLLGEDLGLQLPLLENSELVTDSRGTVDATLQSVVEDTGIANNLFRDASDTIKAIAPTGSGAIELADLGGDVTSTGFDLISGGSYTEYGITLQSEPSAPLESGRGEDSGDAELFDTVENVIERTDDIIANAPDEH
jgi:hypothetical protein